MSNEEDNNSDSSLPPSDLEETAVQTPAPRHHQSPWPPSAPQVALPSAPPPDPQLRQIHPPGWTFTSLLQLAERQTLLQHQINREVESESGMAPSAKRSQDNRLKRRQLGALGAGANHYDVVEPNYDKLCSHGWVVFEPNYDSQTRPEAALPDKDDLCRNAVVHSLHYLLCTYPSTTPHCPKISLPPLCRNGLAS